MVSELGMATEVADLLNDLTSKVEDVAKMQRDPSIPAGTVLAEAEIDGAVHRELKQNSMVRMGKTPLPERFEAWDLYGHSSMLPTAQMARMLSKPNAERPGVRAFHLHRGGVTRENCTTCPPAPPEYEGTCTWCFERSAGSVRKSFASQAVQEAHFAYYHPMEWETFQRVAEREMRQAEVAANRELAQAMLAVAQNRVPTAVVEPEPVADSPDAGHVAAAQAAVAAVTRGKKLTINCPDCGRELKEGGMALHKRRWCPAEER